MAKKISRSKYGAKKTNGYDSKREAKRAQELELMLKAGLISNLKKQVKFILIPAYYEEHVNIGISGRTLKPKYNCVERECSYYADFTYMLNNNLVVEDCKGMKTTEYIIKRKLMLYVHGIRIKES